jgi:hypothetical protein
VEYRRPHANAQQGQQLAAFQRIKHTNPPALSMQTACWSGGVAGCILEHIVKTEIFSGLYFLAPPILNILKVD